MKFSASLLSACLVACAAAGPMIIDVSEDEVLANSQLTAAAAGTTANEFLQSGCKSVIFIYARGTNQAGNIGEMPGPQTVDALKAALGSSSVAAQGVDYDAALLTNILSGGCSASEAADMTALITQAATKCPSSKIAVSGYSQGAAMVHRSVEQLSTSVKAKVAAAVTFGDTQKKQDGSKIPNFDASKTLILCNSGDKVCEGTLQITSAHLDYTGSVDDAVDFIVSKV
ncbi:carbohydrate esterase family 5 protein [Xylariomycetidae sp. FL2044]|nr:carbohydrate esterase family 5 protein [Xylariomycetidae sp. FL2044]